MHLQDYVYFILTIAGSLATLAISIGVILFGLGQFRLGKKEVKTTNIDTANSVVELFKSKSEELEKDLKQLRIEFDNSKKEFGLREEGYKKTISQQEELIKTYAAILQNRNPELERTLNRIEGFLEKLVASNLHNMEILDGQKVREAKIDARPQSNN